MGALLEEAYFVCTDFDRNNNKFWKIQLYDDGVVKTTWGRVGISQQEGSWSFGPKAKAQYNKKIADKLKVKKGRDAYTRVDIISETQPNNPRPLSSSSELADIAAREIDTDCETTKELIKWLSSVNIHQILSNTTMTYNANQGVFKTPLGVVSKSTIDKSRILLNDIATYVQAKDYGAPLKKLATEYLRLIPQNLGGPQQKIKLDRIFTQDTLKKQADILDALDASLATVLTSPPADSITEVEPVRIFNLKLHTVNDDEQIKEVHKLFEDTKQSIHTSSTYKFVKLYSVDIPSMRESWEQNGAKLDNHMRLWHGTKPSNVLSIPKQGLMVPPRTASYVCGRMFGDGLYFSNQSTKSLNYACGYWGGGDQGNRIFMFLADVGMGKYFIPSSSISKMPDGYDSVWAQSKKSGVYNDEMIVPYPDRCNLVYLVEFTK